MSVSVDYLRIFVLNYEFPPVGGGGGRVAQDLCKSLAARGHEVRVQTSWVSGLPPVEQQEGYTIYRSFVFRRRMDRCTVPEMIMFVLCGLIPAWRHVRRWSPDLMHVHFAVPTGLVAWIVSLLTGVPYVLTAHLGDVPGAMPGQTDWLFSIIKPFTVPIWHRAAHVTAVSNYVGGLASRAYGLSVETLHNGIDLTSCPPEPSSPHAPVRLMFAGRFDPQKNLPFLVDLLARVQDLAWHANLFGDGPQMEVVKARIDQYGLAERITLHGWVRPEQVDLAMAQSDVLILPSSFEGMSVVSVQALGYGLAILGSDIGGLLDVVESGSNGFRCPVGDMEAFESALRTLLSDTSRLEQMKRASRQKAADFDLAKIVSRYEAIFREVAQ